MVKIILFLAPIVLFMFKNLLPIIGEAAFSNNGFNIEQLKEEVVQLSTDFLFASISYLLPKIVELIRVCRETTIEINNTDTPIDFNMFYEVLNGYYGKLITYIIICFAFLVMLPFSVFLNKLAISYGDADKKTVKTIIIVVVYLISIGSLIYSIQVY